MKNNLDKNLPKKISVLGTVGLPANYGGFETLIDNLVNYHSTHSLDLNITVYCSSLSYPQKYSSYQSVNLKYIPLKANGIQSVVYDIYSLFISVWNKSDVILLMGVSGAIVLPFVRVISPAKIITNIDGVEWKREKWSPLVKIFLHFSEKIAVKFSHSVIADNDAIADYIHGSYNVCPHVIPYGGDHAVSVDAITVEALNLPQKYVLSICRIEPENNIHLIIEAFVICKSQSLVIVGNWLNSNYGQNLKKKYSLSNNIFLFDPIYDLCKLKTLRSQAFAYVHGHSAGGTNPSLVEAMHFGKPVIAYDCEFNRCTTEDRALFFRNSDDIIMHLASMNECTSMRVGGLMLEIAQRRYTWDVVGKQYFDLLTA